VVLQPTPNMERLGIMQGLAAGLMLCLSFFDLLPEGGLGRSDRAAPH
jgi:hypothetical protein